MGRKEKKKQSSTTDSGHSGPPRAQTSPAAAKGLRKASPSSDESPGADSQKDKQSKKQKQAPKVSGGSESRRNKQQTNGRDASEDAKKPGTKQKGKAGGATVKVASTKEGCCSVLCCVGLLSVIVALAAVAGFAAYSAYPAESEQLIGNADRQLRDVIEIVNNFVHTNMEKFLNADQKSSDSGDPETRKFQDDDDVIESRPKEGEEEEDEEPGDQRNYESSGGQEGGEKVEESAEEHGFEEVVKRDAKVDLETKKDAMEEEVLDDWKEEEVAEDEVERSKEKIVELSVEEELAVEDETVENEGEAVEGDAGESTGDSAGDVEDVKHWELAEEENEKESLDSSAGDGADRVEESFGRREEDVKEHEAPHQHEEKQEVEQEEISTEPRISPEEVAPKPKPEFQEPPKQEVPTQEVPTQEVPTQEVPTQEVPTQEVPTQEVHNQEIPAQEVPVPEVPRQEDLPNEVPEPPAVQSPKVSPFEPEVSSEQELPLGEVIEPEVIEVIEADIGVIQEEMKPGEAVPDAVVFKETADGQDESDVGSRSVPLEANQRQEDVKEMKQELVEEVFGDVSSDESSEVRSEGGGESLESNSPPLVEAQDLASHDDVPAAAAEEGAQAADKPAEMRSQDGAATEAIKETESQSPDSQLDKELDSIDGIVSQTPREAIEMYNRVLAHFPKNPRAVVGKANALGVLSDSEQNDATLEQSIAEYLKVFSIPSVPKSLMVTAARACAERQALRGWSSEAAQTLRSLVAMYPDDLVLYNELGQKYLMNGAYEEARDTFKQILNKDPNDAFALLYLGYIMKMIDRDRGQSLDYMKRGLTTVPVNDLKLYIELGEALTRAGRHVEAHEVYRLAVDRKVLRSPWQRSWHNIDGLTARPWWKPEQTRNIINLQVLEDSWTSIRDEAEDILVNRSSLFVRDHRDIVENGQLQHMKLFAGGRKVTENCEAAVKTCALLGAFSDAIECKQCEVRFLLMQPGLHLFPHCGPTNTRLTAQLPLVIDPKTRIRVADETRTYTSGIALIFDDSFEQELWTTSDNFQLLLSVELWHPDLSVELKSTLGPL